MQYSTKSTRGVIYALLFLLGAVLAMPAGVGAQTIRAVGDFLQIGDVKTSHILNATILNEDVSASAAIDPMKVKGGTGSGALFYDNGSAVGTSSNLKYLPNTTGLTVTGTTTITATTTLRGVNYNWPSADGTNNYTLRTNGAGQLSWGAPSSSLLSQTFTAKEAFTAGQTVALGDGAQTTVTKPATASQCSNVLTEAQYDAAKITTPASSFELLVSVTVSFFNTNGSALFGQPSITIMSDNAGNPGTVLASATSSNSTNINGSSSADFTITLATPLALSQNTAYWFVVRDHLMQGGGLMKTNCEAGNARDDKKTIDTGSSWSALANDLAIGYVYTSNTSGQAYKASAAASDFRSKGFVGLAASTVSAGQSVTVDMIGISQSTTTAAITTSYFLSDTQGALQTSAGTVSRKAGMGLGSAGFLLRPDNP